MVKLNAQQSRLKDKFDILGKSSVSCWEYDEKIDSAFIFLVNLAQHKVSCPGIPGSAALCDFVKAGAIKDSDVKGTEQWCSSQEL